MVMTYMSERSRFKNKVKLISMLVVATWGIGVSNVHAGGLGEFLRKAQREIEDTVKREIDKAGGANPEPQPPTSAPGRTAPRDVYSDRQAQATNEQERKQREVENETYSESEQREIESLTYNGPSRTKDIEPSKVYHWRGGWDGHLTGYSYERLYRSVNGGRSQPYKGFYRLACSYESLTPPHTSILEAAPGVMRFWYRRRPATDIVPAAQFQGHENDVAVDTCPAVFSDALKLAYGDDILDKAMAANEERLRVKAMSPQERRESLAERRAKMIKERYGAYASWDKDAKSNSPARDKELLRKVNSAVASLQRTGRRLSMGELRQTLDNSLREDLLSLASSAKARLDAIPAGPENRAAFDKWDNEVGGHVLFALRRLSYLQRDFSTGDDADFAVAGESSGARALRRNELRDNHDLDFTVPMHNFFATAFKDRLAGQPLLDRPYVEAMKKKLNATRLVSDKWRTTVDAPPATKDRDEQPELMTLDELAAAEFGGAIGRGLGGAVAGYIKIKQANAEFQQRITSARDNFWNCYANRCADAPQRYFEYSKALRDKDMYYMMMPEVQMRFGGKQQAMQMEMFMGMMGSLAIDGGPGREGCSSDWEHAKAGLTLSLGSWKPDLSNIDASREEFGKRVARFTLSPEYLKWQQCRDYQEYIDRPRPLK